MKSLRSFICCDTDNVIVVMHDSQNDNNNKKNNKGDDYGDDGGLLLSSLPLSLLITIVNNLGTQEDLMNVTVLSKQFYKIVHLPVIDTKIIPTYEISPRSRNIKSGSRRGSERNLLQRLSLCRNKNKGSEWKELRLQRYRRFRVNRINEFDHNTINMDTVLKINNLPLINNIESLDVSLPYSSSLPSLAFVVEIHILFAMEHIILPNLKEINLSYVRFGENSPVWATVPFFTSTPLLQKITWHHSSRGIHLAGYPFHPTRTKEIFSDDSLFDMGAHLKQISNLERHDNVFMFYKCKSLKRLSIRNAKYSHFLNDDVSDDTIVGIDIPQNILIKFVRNAPSSMCWFRSNLTKGNMKMLQKERPEIQLLN